MATVIAAVIAALVATFGYTLTVRAKILEDRRKTYASALAAVESYKELPYRIRRRADSTAATRNTLGSAISDAQRDLDYYKNLLCLDSPAVGRAYYALVRVARINGNKKRASAWREPPALSDEKMAYPERYQTKDEEQMNFCLKLMSQELRLLPIERLCSIHPSRIKAAIIHLARR